MLKSFVSVKTLANALRTIVDFVESQKTPEIVCGCSNCVCGIPHNTPEDAPVTYELTVSDLGSNTIKHWKLTKKGRLKPVRKKVKTVNDISTNMQSIIDFIRTAR